MSIIKKIFIPTDFSESAQHAFDYGVALAREHAAALVIHHAYLTPVMALPDGVIAPPAADIAEGLARMAAGLERLQVQARERGVRHVETVLREGVAWRTIVDAAQALSCDMIIMGTHGRSGVTRFLLGSVAEKVIRKAHCPVLAVKSPAAVALAAAPSDTPADELC